MAGVAGLTVLDAATMQRVGGVSTTGNAQGVAALPAFRMDVNGDGAIAPATEVFDLAVVANGIDGTLQFYRVPPIGDPVLLSAVRFSGAETADVQVDATERLAYVALGSRGLAIVDLDGPASVQPIDGDRNGVDDRILGTTGAPGSRVALDAPRGTGLVADGPHGVTLLQLLPARSRILTLRRDPIPGLAGDEEDILSTGRAFTTDAAVRLAISTTAAFERDLQVVVGEQTDGAPSLSFGNRSTTATIPVGLAEATVHIARGARPAHATLTVVQPDGSVLARASFTLEDPDLAPRTLTRLLVAPETSTLTPSAPQAQLAVGGAFDDGRTYNLTTGASGTTYQAADPVIAQVSADGAVTGAAGGSTYIVAAHRDQQVTAAVDSTLTAIVTALVATGSYVTIRAIGDSVPFPGVARMSDGDNIALDEAALATFQTSSASVVTVDPDGTMVATGPGAATVTATTGALAAQVQVSVEPRTAPTVSGITVRPPTHPPAVGAPAPAILARLAGTGSLDGLTVHFAFSGATTASADETTNADGGAGTLIPVTAAGQLTVTATVIDPASGAARSATQAVTVAAAAGDSEPNSTDATAAPLPPGQALSGTVNSTSDARDVYRLDTEAGGTLDLTILLPSDGAPSSVVVVLRTPAGEEIARLTPTDAVTTLSAQVPAGTYVSVEALSGSVSYEIESEFEPVPLVITGVSPASGPPGTPVTISGTGFSPRREDNQVFFGGIAATVVSATATTVQTIVPALGVSGPLKLISGSRGAQAPSFTTGINGPPPPSYLRPRRPNTTREAPTSGVLVDVTRLIVTFDPALTAAAVAAVAQSQSGAIVGFLPPQNTYVLEFAENTTIDGLVERARSLRALPSVVLVSMSVQNELDTIDLRDSGRGLPGTRYADFRAVGPDRTVPGSGRHPVHTTVPRAERPEARQGRRRRYRVQAPVHVGLHGTGRPPVRHAAQAESRCRLGTARDAGGEQGSRHISSRTDWRQERWIHPQRRAEQPDAA